MLPYMIQHNWLLNYSKIEGIQSTLTGMASRTSFVSNMQFAAEELTLYYQDFDQEFKLFFEDARKHFGDLY
jgi:acyl carrier protein phosphodiesterase